MRFFRTRFFIFRFVFRNIHDYFIGVFTKSIFYIDVIVAVADAISAARPGARRESLDAYIKRLEKLEELAQAFNGVSKAYAIQAGREVRVVLSSNNTDDGTVHKLTYDIARKIEAEMKYPGQIKVNVSRETRATEFANQLFDQHARSQ